MKYAFSQFSHKVINSTFILSLREAFISLLPYLILSASASLALAAVDVFSLLPPDSAVYQWIYLLRQALSVLFPVVAVVAISYYISQNIGVNTLEGSILAVACFVTNSGYLLHTADDIVLNVEGAAAYSILIPVMTTYLLAYLARLKIFNIFESRFVSVFLVKNINMILPFLLTFFIVFLLLPVVSDFLKWIVTLFISDASHQGVESTYAKWSVIVHIFWLLGVHGENVTISMVDTSFLQQYILPNITVQSFVDTFITLGGAGSIIGLVIAALLVSRDETLKQVSRISLPFNIFDISEIIVYGVPIVLNPYFVIPFLLCPLVNFGLAYLGIASGLVPVVDISLPWITPILVSGYFVGGGSFITVLFQLLLVIVSTLIYLPFVRIYSSANSEQLMLEQLSTKLSVSSEIEGQTEKRHLSEQGRLLKANQKLKRIIDEITAGELLLYYQPKMNTQGQCYGFEALLRFKQQNGVVVPPYFLSSLEKAGFSDVIDWWVIDKVVEDLENWKRQNFEPRISINLNPTVLSDDALIDKLIRNFSRYEGQIEIEILETAYIKNFMMIRENIGRLKAHGIYTAIDDFGTGFSSLSLLYKLNANTIKLDKSILDNIDSEKGQVLYSQLCSLCKNLGFKLVAEGVETEEQAAFVMRAGIDLIQGSFYAAAMPADKAMGFSLHVNS
jgi:lactose/cellobiose-specific phosphotransferase system IIC component